ncbi:FAD-binding oxidoreductase [Streptomyces sp. NPDC015127]|uniref:FAD-binding oxidoreductase n=1 Tax=Streptomyces sp. NPDC015127 TaxID=3364939 RepID=UPI00370243F2
MKLDEAAYEEFSKKFDGSLWRPGDSGYGKARTLWNAELDYFPALIAQCRSVAQVQAAIKFAKSADLKVTVRGGGHDIAGRSMADGALVVDVSAMNNVQVDPERQLAICGGGSTWGDLDRASQAHGLATTGGQASTTGIAGVSLGGGVGWLMRRYGLAIDNLLAVTIVTPSGDLIRTHEGSFDELFWALRGGGFGFGVIVSLEFQLHSVGQVVAGKLFHPIGRLPEALRLIEEVAEKAPDDLTVLLVSGRVPDIPEVDANVRGDAGFSIVVCQNLAAGGDNAAAGAALRDMQNFGPPVGNTVRKISYIELQTMYDASPAALYGYGQSVQSLYLKGMDDRVIQVISQRLNEAPSGMCVIELISLGGAIGRVKVSETPFSGRNDTLFCVFAATWSEPEQAAEHMRWTRESGEAIREAAGTGRTYINYIEAPHWKEQHRESLGEDAIARLRALRDEMDPEGVFLSRMD